MGLLFGQNLEPTKYTKMKCFQKVLRKNAILQIIELLRRFGKFQNQDKNLYKYGTEIELFFMKKIVKEKKQYYSIAIEISEYQKKLNIQDKNVLIFPEFAGYMLEITPSKPFLQILNPFEIIHHFQTAKSIFKKDSHIIPLQGSSVFPTMGSQDFYSNDNGEVISPKNNPKINKYSKSETFLDQLITDHSRFKSFAQNTRIRRQSKPQIHVPILQDKNTIDKEMIFDHFGIGMGCNAVQVTFSTQNLDHARWLYDQFHCITAFFTAASASTAIMANTLMDWDVRLKLLEQSVDDRTPIEQEKLSHSKYSPSQFFISKDKRNMKHYNDSKYTLNKSFLKSLRNQLKKSGSEFYKDKKLLVHFGYLFIREILVILPETIVEDDFSTTRDFEAINSCNWNDVRLKFPSNYDEEIGFLIEFRPMENAITYKEKTALIYFVTLLHRMISDKKLGLNFYIPISKVNENFNKAIQRNAFSKGKMYFRKYFCEVIQKDQIKKDDIVELTMEEFLLGNEEFLGLKQVLQKYKELNPNLFGEKSDQINYHHMIKIFEFLVARSKGELLTSAQYIRNFVNNHSQYKQDSKVPNEIINDLLENLLIVIEQDESELMLGQYLNFMNKIENQLQLINQSKINQKEIQDKIFFQQNIKQ